MGGTTSMWADGQMPSADLDPGPVQVADAKPAEAKAIVGRSPGQLALMRLRRDRTARVQLGSRRQGAGWDSSGSQLIDRRWIYEYDAWAEAAALT